MNNARLKVLKPLVLVGLMGAGKSTIGARLAKRLNLSFVDTDNVVQDEVGCSIKEMMKYAGEDFFRQKEKEVIEKILAKDPCVISTGGGAFINDETRKLIKEKSISIWLKADFEVILDRVSRRNTRPLLEEGDKAETIQRLIDERYPIYSEANIVINSDNGSHMVIVDSIVKSLIELGK